MIVYNTGIIKSSYLNKKKCTDNTSELIANVDHNLLRNDNGIKDIPSVLYVLCKAMLTGEQSGAEVCMWREKTGPGGVVV